MPAAICCWCGSVLEQRSIEGPWWCSQDACAARQAEWGVVRDGRYWFVPAPKQVEFLASPAKHRLFGGAAGPGKSHAARWGLYRKCHAVPGFEALILRKTMPELRKSHLRKMERERQVFDAEFLKSESVLKFPNGSLLEFGHLEDEDAVSKYLSSEYDEICADEGSTFDGELLLELSTRARTSKAAVQALGGAKFDVVTNPGGRGWAVLRDFFIDHTPDFDRYPALKDKYRPDQWVYVKALLDDNPYRDPDYEGTLAVLNSARYEQLRWGSEYVTEGQFFEEWRPEREGQPYHCRTVDIPTGTEWSAGMDWGHNAWGWCGFVAHLPDGHYHLKREYKFRASTADTVATELRKIQKDLGIKHLRSIAGDPAMWAKTGAGKGESIAETLIRRGLPMRKADNDRFNGALRMHEMLRDDGQGTPFLTVDPIGCPYFVRSLPGLVQDKHNPDDVDTSKDDHAYDGCRYWAMSRPSPTVIQLDTKPPVGSWQWHIDAHHPKVEGVLS